MMIAALINADHEIIAIIPAHYEVGDPRLDTPECRACSEMVAVPYGGSVHQAIRDQHRARSAAHEARNDVVRAAARQIEAATGKPADLAAVKAAVDPVVPAPVYLGHLGEPRDTAPGKAPVSRADWESYAVEAGVDVSALPARKADAIDELIKRAVT